MRALLFATAIMSAVPAMAAPPEGPVATPAITALPADAASAEYQAKTAKNRAAFLAFVELYYGQHKTREAFERYVAKDYMQHNPNAPDGREEAIAFLATLMSGPDISMDVRRILVDGDYAVVHLLARQGPEDRGHAIMNIFRMKDGIIVEHWDVTQKIPEETASGRSMG